MDGALPSSLFWNIAVSINTVAISHKKYTVFWYIPVYWPQASVTTDCWYNLILAISFHRSRHSKLYSKSTPNKKGFSELPIFFLWMKWLTFKTCQCFLILQTSSDVKFRFNMVHAKVHLLQHLKSIRETIKPYLI